MNKLLIPSIMVAVVMIAGIFAFVPVNQASTIHATELLPALAGATTVRIVETLDDSTGLSGNITIDRVAGAGPWTIESLQICDFEFQKPGAVNTISSSSWVFYSVETDILGDNFSISGSAPNLGEWGLNVQNPRDGRGTVGVGEARNYSGSGILLSDGYHLRYASISGSSFGSVENGADGTCISILDATIQNNSGGSGDPFALQGDEDNDVILHFMRSQTGDSMIGDGDGAFLIAYISGVESASDISIIDELNP